MSRALHPPRYALCSSLITSLTFCLQSANSTSLEEAIALLLQHESAGRRGRPGKALTAARLLYVVAGLEMDGITIPKPVAAPSAAAKKRKMEGPLVYVHCCYIYWYDANSGTGPYSGCEVAVVGCGLWVVGCGCGLGVAVVGWGLG